MCPMIWQNKKNQIKQRTTEYQHSQNQKTSIKFTVKLKHLKDSGDRYFQLNTAIIYDGVCTIIKNSSAIKQLSVLSSDDVIESLQKDYDIHLFL